MKLIIGIESVKFIVKDEKTGKRLARFRLPFAAIDRENLLAIASDLVDEPNKLIAIHLEAAVARLVGKEV